MQAALPAETLWSTCHQLQLQPQPGDLVAELWNSVQSHCCAAASMQTRTHTHTARTNSHSCVRQHRGGSPCCHSRGPQLRTELSPCSTAAATHTQTLQWAPAEEAELQKVHPALLLHGLHAADRSTDLQELQSRPFLLDEALIRDCDLCLLELLSCFSRSLLDHKGFVWQMAEKSIFHPEHTQSSSEKRARQRKCSLKKEKKNSDKNVDSSYDVQQRKL